MFLAFKHWNNEASPEETLMKYNTPGPIVSGTRPANDGSLVYLQLPLAKLTKSGNTLITQLSIYNVKYT